MIPRVGSGRVESTWGAALLRMLIVGIRSAGPACPAHTNQLSACRLEHENARFCTRGGSGVGQRRG
eukprot:2631273-Rhodomonas_salina.2